MIERSIIHIGGKPGSGKSRMARALVERLEGRAEHISIGDEVRKLAAGAISSTFGQSVNLHIANPYTANDPLDEEIILTLLDNALKETTRSNADIVFLDGYPRYPHQVRLFAGAAEKFDYQTPGAIIAETDDETAFARMIKRSMRHPNRHMADITAWNKLANHNIHYENVIRSLGARSTFEVFEVDTSGDKAVTDARAFEATMRLIGEPLPKSA